jgi:hypothetical protein
VDPRVKKVSTQSRKNKELQTPNMALTFAANSLHLANWGFSLGDVAVLAGAGRQVITWLTADSRDTALLDFLKVTPSDLSFRRGLVDPVALNKRWSKRLALLRNGERIEVCPEGDKGELDNFNRFTWIMTLIVVCLDEIVAGSTVRDIIVAFTERLFVASTLEIEYLNHEIPEHIKGWRSIGATRMMVVKAGDVWKKLESQKLHLPGYVPKTESEEILRFLQWIVMDGTNTFITPSTDVHSFAILLSEMGFDCLKAELQKESVPEGFATVFFDESLIPLAIDGSAREKRRGMRVPLKYMEEAVSLWPGTADANNKRRMIFKNGYQVSKALALRAVSSPFGNGDTDPGILISSLDTEPLAREDTEIRRLAEHFLPLVNKSAMKGLTEIIDSWRIQSLELRNIVLSGLADTPMANIHAEQYVECKADLQIFLLGYYYGMLGSILDDTRIAMKEAFGSWGWNDDDFFVRIAAFVKSGMKTDERGAVRKNGILYWRYQVLRIAAYLLAGAEPYQVDAIGLGSIGLHARLTITTSALLGDADTPEKITKFCLLDIDPTTIPCNGLGIIKPGKQSNTAVQAPMSFPLVVSQPIPAACDQTKDFTSHIEPAWGYDPNLCLVAYRYEGRLIHKVDPTIAEMAVLRWWTAKDTNEQIEKDSQTFPQSVEQIMLHALSQNPFAPTYVGQASEFYSTLGGTIVIPTIESKSDTVNSPTWVYLMHTKGMSRVRSCIVAMYNQFFADKSFKDVVWGWTEFSWDENCPGALAICIDLPGVFGNGTVILL